MSVAEASRAATPKPAGVVRGPMPWEQVGVACLLAATAAMFLWGLDRNGWANPYYSAAAQAGSQDWKAFFYGSLDAGNLITVDKPPLSIWIMSLSVRLFGLNSWALLVPQALMGVATTWLIYKIIRRGHSAAPALLGGLLYATTPVVVLMSRYNNPEPLMGLLTVAAVYFVLRGIEGTRWTWYFLAGTSLGLGFMAKQVQAFLPIPALILAVLIFGAGTMASRLLRLIAALVALIVSGGWWMVIVELTPAANRPYVGGSATNSILELTLDYNGLARFVRPVVDTRSVSSNQAVVTYDGGWFRLFNGNFAPESGWLLATAIMCVLVAAVLRSLSPMKTAARALLLTSSIWFATVYVVLSFMGTMIHSYYVFSLGAPLSLIVATALSLLRENSNRLPVRLIGATTVATTSYMTIRILGYGKDWPPILLQAVIAAGLIATMAWLFAPKTKFCIAFVAVCLVLGPVAANSHTVLTAQNGTNPVSGPVSADPRAISRHLENVKAGKPSWALQIAYGAEPSEEVSQMLSTVDPQVTWPAATYTAQNAARYQLETHRPVMAVGGWLGTDPAPTLDEFKTLVNQNEVAYFIWQQDMVDLGRLGSDATAISSWVESTFSDRMIDGLRIYDLRS